MPASFLGRRRARPVADAPALDGAELARAWLVELVAQAPIERAARLPGPRFADDAPRLCGAVVSALASDAALDDLEPGGPLAPLAAGSGHMAGALSPADAVAALDALRAVAWTAIVRALDRPEPAQVADLADRLATVVGTLASAAIEAPHPLGPPQPGGREPLATVLRPRPEGDEPAREGRDVFAPPARGEHEFAPPRGDATTVAAPRGEASDVSGAPDGSAVTPGEGPDRGDAPEGFGAPPGEEPDAGDALARIEATLHAAAAADDPLAEAAARLRALAADPAVGLELDEPPPDPFGAARLRGATAAPGPAVEDATGFAATRLAPWTAGIERRLERHRRDGLPFAVLCLELVGADRLAAAADEEHEVARALEAAESAVLSELRPADALVRERPGRYWLTAPDTDGTEARGLAHRIARAVAALPPHRGVPLQVATGVVTCPDDGTEASSLEALAEEAMFAARAAGLRVAGPSR